MTPPNTRRLLLRSLERYPAAGPEDRLTFEPGVNVLVGAPNTGKSSWLRMLDYLQGDTDSPDGALGELAEKYERAVATFEVEGEALLVERRWRESGKKTKVLVNGDELPAAEFSGLLLDHLGIPRVHFPKGNPYAETAWPELSWRMLLRHVYRRETSWSDLADRQPEGEQHAVLLQFLGLAEAVFPERLGLQVSRRKQLLALEARQTEFRSLLDEISRDLIDDPSIGVSPTAESIAARIRALEEQLEGLSQRREELLSRAGSAPAASDAALAEERLQLVEERDNQAQKVARAAGRRQDLAGYRQAVQAELDRIDRAVRAGAVLSDLRVTHCPVCDQGVDPHRSQAGSCFLCSQPYDSSHASASRAEARLDFEREQLQDETVELAELLARLDSEVAAGERRLGEIDARLSLLDAALHPRLRALAAALSPELALVDAERGRLTEVIRQLTRLGAAVEKRRGIAGEIDALSGQIEALTRELSALSDDAPFAASSELLSDGMNTYLNALTADDSTRWQEGGVSASVTARSSRILVGGRRWNARLGATLQCYLLMAYQYSLLALSGAPGCHYPGFAVVDFLPTLADHTSIADKENYLVAPFVGLIAKELAGHAQLIVAGRAFEGLEGAHRVSLTTVW